MLWVVDLRSKYLFCHSLFFHSSTDKSYHFLGHGSNRRGCRYELALRKIGEVGTDNDTSYIKEDGYL